MYEFLLKFCRNSFIGIGIDTNIEVIVVSLTTWEGTTARVVTTVISQ